MRKRYVVFLFVMIPILAISQAPQSIKYQATARDLTGDPVINQDIAVKSSVLKGSDFDPVVYSELHETASNGPGLFNLEIGNRVEILSGNFSEIGWRYFSHFLKIEIDITGGSNFQLMGVSQFASVPNALFAHEAGNAQKFTAGTGINIGNGVITNTAPDKTLTIASGNGISATGTYPNFMVSNTNPDQNVTLTSGFGITTSGAFPNFIITNLKPNATYTGEVSETTELLKTQVRLHDSFHNTGFSVLADDSTHCQNNGYGQYCYQCCPCGFYHTCNVGGIGYVLYHSSEEH